MRMLLLLLASAILLVAGPSLACGYDQTASSQKSDQVATGSGSSQTPPETQPHG
jgi:hypothetical protein